MKKATPILFAAALLGVVYWQLQPSNEPVVSPAAPRDIPKPTAATPEKAAVISTQARPRVDRPERQSTIQPVAQKEEPVVAAAETISLRQLIPDWLLQQGEVRSERIKVGDGYVDRLRSRYSWPDDGGSVEIEVSDLGVGATEDQFKSLGFDFALSEEETEDGVRMIDDRKDYIANLEYSDEGGEGQVQYLVAGRFLMEVQLEGFPLDSFQVLEDRHSLIGRLVEHAGK